MFAFALAASFRDGAPNVERAQSLERGYPLGALDGWRRAEAPHAAAGVGRWQVVRRDAAARPIWDPVRGLLFSGDVRLYNRPELLGELADPAAAPLHECSDLELARRAYLIWGDAAPSHLVGDFAFAAWHENERTLFLARDHYGVRPLCYRRLADGLVVASDVQQLLAISNRCELEIDPSQVLHYLTRSPRDPGRTCFREIATVPPGHVIRLGETSTESVRYWRPSFAGSPAARYDDVLEEIRAAFARAVADRLESEHPIVAHSSGGFDSSTILMAADRIYRADPGRAPLVMAAGVAPGFPSDESRYMDAVAASVSFEDVRWNIILPGLPPPPDVAMSAPVLRRGPAGGPRGDLELARARGARVLVAGILGDGLWHATGVRRDMVRRGRWLEALRDIARAGTVGSVHRLADAGLGPLAPATAMRMARRLFDRPSRAPRWLGPSLRESFPAKPRPPALANVEWPSHLLCAGWSRVMGQHVAQVTDSHAAYAAGEGMELRAPYADVRLTEVVLRIPWQLREPRGHFRRTGRDALGPMLPEVFSERIGQPPWTDAWIANARHTAHVVAPLIEGGPWLSAPYVDRGIARSMLQGLLAGGDAASADTCMIIPQFGALEAWLRRVFR
jgi:asparagine synthase (glutamine-hydrolysing)